MTKPTLSLDESKVAILMVGSASIAQSVGLVLNQLIFIGSGLRAQLYASHYIDFKFKLPRNVYHNLILTKFIVAYLYDHGMISCTNLRTSLSQSDNHEASNSHAIGETHIISAIPTNNSLKQWDNSNYRILSANSAADIELIRAAKFKKLLTNFRNLPIEKTLATIIVFKTKRFFLTFGPDTIKSYEMIINLTTRANLVLTKNTKVNEQLNNREHCKLSKLNRSKL